jgi:hypothetical protein
MTLKHCVLLLIFGVFCCSCVEENDFIPKIDIVTLDRSFENTIHLDSIVKSYSIIELETSDNYLIGKISQLEFTNERFYVSDRRNSTIIAYNINGKALFRLTSVGRGPDGFSDNVYIQVDSSYTLYVLSGYKGIISFDSTGKYLSTVNHNTQREKYQGVIIALALTGSGEFYLWNGTAGINKDNYLDAHLIYKLNRAGRITETYMPIKHGFMGTYKIFFGNEGNYLLLPINGNDTIYRVHSSGIGPAYYIDFGPTKIPNGALPNTYENYLKEYFRIQRETDFSNGVNGPIETKNYLFFQFVNRYVVRSVLYSHLSGKTISGTFAINQLLPYPAFSCSFNNKLVGYIEPSKAHLIKDEVIEKFSPLELEIFQKIKNIDQSNNPVLLVLEIKDF